MLSLIRRSSSLQTTLPDSKRSNPPNHAASTKHLRDVSPALGTKDTFVIPEQSGVPKKPAKLQRKRGNVVSERPGIIHAATTNSTTTTLTPSTVVSRTSTSGARSETTAVSPLSTPSMAAAANPFIPEAPPSPVADTVQKRQRAKLRKKNPSPAVSTERQEASESAPPSPKPPRLTKRHPLDTMSERLENVDGNPTSWLQHPFKAWARRQAIRDYKKSFTPPFQYDLQSALKKHDAITVKHQANPDQYENKWQESQTTLAQSQQNSRLYKVKLVAYQKNAEDKLFTQPIQKIWDEINPILVSPSLQNIRPGKLQKKPPEGKLPILPDSTRMTDAVRKFNIERKKRLDPLIRKAEEAGCGHIQIKVNNLLLDGRNLNGANFRYTNWDSSNNINEASLVRTKTFGSTLGLLAEPEQWRQVNSDPPFYHFGQVMDKETPIRIDEKKADAISPTVMFEPNLDEMIKRAEEAAKEPKKAKKREIHDYKFWKMFNKPSPEAIQTTPVDIDLETIKNHLMGLNSLVRSEQTGVTAPEELGPSCKLNKAVAEAKHRLESGDLNWKLPINEFYCKYIDAITNAQSFSDSFKPHRVNPLADEFNKMRVAEYELEHSNDYK